MGTLTYWVNTEAEQAYEDGLLALMSGGVHTIFGSGFSTTIDFRR